MRFDPILDSFYVLGSLWGAPTGPSICTANPFLSVAVRGTVGTPASKALPAVTAFVEVNVVPMDSERVLTKQTVVVQGGRITVLGPAAAVQIPAGVTRIDGRGKYLIPGLNDMHADGNGTLTGRSDRYGPAHLLNLLASGVTAIRPNNPVTLDQLHALRHSQSIDEQPGPYLYVSGDPRAFAEPGMSADSLAAAYKAAGYNWTVDTQDSILTALRRLGLPLASHSHGGSVEYIQRLGAHGGSIDHLYAFLTYNFLDSLDQGTANRSVPELQAVAAAARRTGVWVTPTLDCMEVTSGRLTPPAIEIHRQLVKAMYDSGVGLLLGAEGANVYRELRALVRAGLTPYQALVTGTRNPAQYLGLLDERGTVAVGKRADLVLLNGNPLQDIQHVREPTGVMLGGRWFDRVELDRRLLASPTPKAGLTTIVRRAAIDWSPKADWPIDTLRWERRKKVETHMRRLEDLSDSLATAQAKSPAYERVLRLVAAELGEMRGLLTKPDQYELFDSAARVWLREQARQGYGVAVPGVLLMP